MLVSKIIVFPRKRAVVCSLLVISLLVIVNMNEL